MRRIHTSLQAKSQDFDPHGVGPLGGMILLTVAELGGAEVSELTRYAARDKSQMTRMLGALEQKGAITRQTSQRDARATFVSLTPLGKEIVEALRGALTETVDGLLAHLDTADKDKLAEIMARAAGAPEDEHPDRD